MWTGELKLGPSSMMLSAGAAFVTTNRLGITIEDCAAAVEFTFPPDCNRTRQLAHRSWHSLKGRITYSTRILFSQGTYPLFPNSAFCNDTVAHLTSLSCTNVGFVVVAKAKYALYCTCTMARLAQNKATAGSPTGTKQTQCRQTVLLPVRTLAWNFAKLASPRLLS